MLKATSYTKKYKRNGDFILIKHERLPNGQFRNTWILDPVATLTPDDTVNEAFREAVNNSSTPYTSPDNATVEFTATEYTNVQTENAVYASHSASVTIATRYANVAHLFKFNTSGYENITDITCIWKGYEANMTGVNKLQVYKATAWEDWVTNLPTTNTKYTKSLGNGSSYFYSSTWIRFGAYMAELYIGEPITVTLYTDYAALQITYGIVIAPIMDGLIFASILKHQGQAILSKILSRFGLQGVKRKVGT